MKSRITFSIEALQLRYGDRRALEIAKEIGSDGVDFSLYIFTSANKDDIYSKSDEEIIAYFSELKKCADKLGLIIGQTHGRITGYNRDEVLNQQKRQDARKDIMVTSILGAPICVFHMISTGRMGFDTEPEEMYKLNYRMYMDYLKYAKEYNVQIAFETFGNVTVNGVEGLDFFAAPDTFLHSYRELKANKEYGRYLTVCMDTGHTNKVVRMGVPKPADYIRLLGNEITALHLNDNDGGKADQHKIPLTGSIDWIDVWKALKEIGYHGNYNLELNLNFFGEELLIETASFAIKVLREMLKNN